MHAKHAMLPFLGIALGERGERSPLITDASFSENDGWAAIMYYCRNVGHTKYRTSIYSG